MRRGQVVVSGNLRSRSASLNKNNKKNKAKTKPLELYELAGKKNWYILITICQYCCWRKSLLNFYSWYKKLRLIADAMGCVTGINWDRINSIKFVMKLTQKTAFLVVYSIKYCLFYSNHIVSVTRKQEQNYKIQFYVKSRIVQQTAEICTQFICAQFICSNSDVYLYIAMSI
jgi:hypothetical protein